MTKGNAAISLRVSAMVTILMVAVSAFGERAAARRNACDGSHGAYTSILCDGDDLFGSGAYLISPNGNVRLYMQPNAIRSLDMTTSPETVLYTLYDGSIGDPKRIRGLGDRFEIWDENEDTLHYSESPQGFYVGLRNDGCLWHFQSDDSPIAGICTFQ